MKKQSEELYMFYLAYNNWRNAGAPGDIIFSRQSGLCGNLWEYFDHKGSGTQVKMKLEMLGQFEEEDLDLTMPFNPQGSSYGLECWRALCHVNEARIAWVEARILDGYKKEFLLDRILAKIWRKE